MTNKDHEAHDYAERIRERLPRRLQELRKRCGLSKYGLARESGVSREYLGEIERSKASPTQPIAAQISRRRHEGCAKRSNPLCRSL
jgi:DNA-binding XRE family transcriptional regulator